MDNNTGWQPVTTVGFDHEKLAIYVWRSVRAGGDMKTRVIIKGAETINAVFKKQSAWASGCPFDFPRPSKIKMRLRSEAPKPHLNC